MNCKQCARPIPGDALVCPFCGAPSPDAADSADAGHEPGSGPDTADSANTGHEPDAAGSAGYETGSGPGAADGAGYETGSGPDMAGSAAYETGFEPDAGAPGARRPDQGASEASAEKRRNSVRKALLIIGGAVLIMILAVVLVRVFEHNARVKKYNAGVTQLEEKKYEEALETFTELGSFEDSEYMASYARMELDYLTLGDLVASGEYTRAAEILKNRSGFYGDTDTGKEAAALAEEYLTVSAAYAAMGSGNYAKAEEDFESLDKLKNDYAEDKCLCRAHLAEEEKNWLEVILNLYAIQSDDPGLGFLENPRSDGETMLRDSRDSGDDPDPEAVEELLQTQDPETETLKTTAVNGLRYNEAGKLLDSGKYEKAMKAFEELGDFMDAKTRYEETKRKYEALEASYAQAEKFYKNKEYYKARKEFLSISDYKDAKEKAESCKQSMPENGALKSGNGGIAFTIYAPDISKSVFVKLYDSDGDSVGQVFLHSGNNSTLSMQAGTYTIKVAYGTEWYGEKDLFGEGGDYYQLLNGSDTEFVVENGYTYSLELLVSEGGNVGSQRIGGAAGMQ